jgi:hypothetical protein
MRVIVHEGDKRRQGVVANILNSPDTLTGAIRYFGSEQKCHDLLVATRWPKEIRCPICHSKDVGKLAITFPKDRKGRIRKTPRRVWNCKKLPEAVYC